ncbi:hypothetical protein EI94DRAFT_1902729 [Lactarius quietus]|nr:hypothetical protein EI94DRAFT_1902729 [Lactarius quietus]
MHGYRPYVSPAKEDFHGIAMLVTNKLAFYEVPHGLHWLIHVKVFNYAGLQGPIHFINVYLKSGGNHRQTQKDQLTVVKNIVTTILERDRDSRVVVLGDMNEPEKQLVCHLNAVGDKCNHLFPACLVGSCLTHFPVIGETSAINNFLVTEAAQRLFRAGRVLCCYDLSDHRPMVMSPYANLVAVERRVKPVRPAFDSKMMYLKGDKIVDDNTQIKLMQHAYQKCDVDGDTSPIADDKWRAEVSAEADKFIPTFDQVCHKHDVKKVHQPGSKPEFPQKLRMLQQTVHKYSKWYHAALDCNQTPDKSTCIWLAWAQMLRSDPTLGRKQRRCLHEHWKNCHDYPEAHTWEARDQKDIEEEEAVCALVAAEDDSYLAYDEACRICQLVSNMITRGRVPDAGRKVIAGRMKVT